MRGGDGLGTPGAPDPRQTGQGPALRVLPGWRNGLADDLSGIGLLIDKMPEHLKTFEKGFATAQNPFRFGYNDA